MTKFNEHKLPGASHNEWPDVAVIIPVYNQCSSLEICLQAIRTQTYNGNYNVIVIDNGSTENLADLKERFCEVTFLAEAQIGSYSARNTGIASTRAKILAFTDADCRPDANWLHYGVGSLMSDSKIKLVGGRIDMILSGGRSHSLAELYDFASGFQQRRNITQRKFAATANMITWRNLMDVLGPFDAQLRSAGDTEWGRRVFKAGHVLVYEDNAVVHHVARTSRAEIFKKMKRTAGGARDLAPTWPECIRDIIKHLAPPFPEAAELFIGQGRFLKNRQKLAILIFAWEVRLRRVYERLRLQITGVPTPRS